MAKAVPAAVVDKNKRDEGVIKLRKETSLSDIKLEAFICACVAYFHSKDPSFHSWYSPINKIKQKIITASFVEDEMCSKEGIGIKSAISMSNTKNSTAKMKNRNENGMRALL